MAKKNARLTKSLAGTGGMKLEQLHACVNQIPAEESGLHLLDCVKREVVICAIWRKMSSAHTLLEVTPVVNGIQNILTASVRTSAIRALPATAGGAVLRPRDYTGKFC